MNQHSKSLLFSIVVHSLLLATLFYVYTTASTYIGKSKEKRVCIKLGTIQEVAASSSEVKKKEIKKSATKKPQKKIEKKPKKIIKKKPVEKKIKKPSKVEKKKLKKVPKKEPVQKRVPKKVVEEPTVIEELIPKIEEEAGTQEACAKEKSATTQEEACKNDSTATQTTQVQSAQEEYLNRHLQEIAKLLQENLYYPRRARKRGIEGKVVVRFAIKKDGEVEAIEIISSNADILSRGAIRTLEDLSGEFPKPDEKLILTVPISYHLSH